MQRQHRHGWSKPDAPGARGDDGKRQIGAGQHAESAEMVLADPCRVEPNLFRVNRFVDDVGDQLVRGALVVLIMVVTEREIAEPHLPALLLFTYAPALSSITPIDKYRFRVRPASRAAPQHDRDECRPASAAK